jgi:aspartyl-tRNA(Asn)/glutamyl-tRNA(Gln) amidotransferase subunit A
MSEARRAVAAGELDRAEILAWPGERLEVENAELNAVTWVAPQPCPICTEGPLAGFAGGLKANLCHRGWRTDCGSRLLEGWHAPYDATVTARLKEAGARLVGTTNMDEFGMGSSCEYSAWGPARNPWDPTRTPGGSSGGSAAAVAAGLLWYALGSDTGGSVRLPAHCCGLVGLKPTWGGVSRFGLVAFASSLDTVGVLARSVVDASEVFVAIAGPDVRDATCNAPAAGVSEPPDPDAGLAGLRVGVPRDLIDAEATAAVRSEFARAEVMLRDAGARLVNVDLDLPGDPVGIYAVLAAAEAASNLARFDGSLYGCREPGDDYGSMLRATRGRGFGTEVKRRILLGTHVLAADRRQRGYERADLARRAVGAAFASLFARVDLVALPTAPEPAFALGSRRDDPLAMHRSDLFTVPASLAGLPAVTVPTGCDSGGLPLSLQLVGPAWSEARLLRAAARVEERAVFRERKEAPWHRPG